MKFTSEVYSNLEKKHYVEGIFMDLSKAFDSLDHKMLLEKLNNIRIGGTPLNLFSSYLTNRKQAVYCSRKTLMQINIVEVPQGSILLFPVYINDISNASNKFNYVLRADDINLFLQDNDLDHLNAVLNVELEENQ